MDFCDQATEQENQQREIAIANARNHPPVLIAKGSCYNCHEELTDTDTQQACFCDGCCRDDWQLRNPRR